MNLRFCAILNCNMGGNSSPGQEESALAQRRANLFEKLVQARGIA